MPVQFGLAENARASGRSRRFEEGNFRGVADYLFETVPGESPGPQALIARQAPGWTLPVHFHRQYQFQVVLRGGGVLGPHTLMPGSVHYTSPQAAYGPIIAGPEGLDYFTLRVLTEKGAWYFPEARSSMNLGMFKEQRSGTPNVGGDSGSWQVLIPPRDDGLGAWARTAQLGDRVAPVKHESGAGRFHLVIRGRFLFDDVELPRESCLFWTPPGDGPTLHALEPDSFLVAVQFPRQALDNNVPPELQVAPSPSGVLIK